MPQDARERTQRCFYDEPERDDARDARDANHMPCAQHADVYPAPLYVCMRRMI